MHTKCFSITQNRLENVGKARRRDTRLCGCFYFCGIKLDGGTRIEWIALTKIVGNKLHQLIMLLSAITGRLAFDRGRDKR